MINVTYDYYSKTYNGISIPTEDDFNRVYNRVYTVLSDYTLSKVDNLTEDSPLSVRVKNCLCEMADAYFIYQKNENLYGGNKASESVGKWSVSYVQDTIPKSHLSVLYKVADTHLGNTYLLCRWL